jgi:hypothetical protein
MLNNYAIKRIRERLNVFIQEKCTSNTIIFLVYTKNRLQETKVRKIWQITRVFRTEKIGQSPITHRYASHVLGDNSTVMKKTINMISKVNFFKYTHYRWSFTQGAMLLHKSSQLIS